MNSPRSYLFVPGDRPDRLEKSLSLGADAIIGDLEDAVAPAAKDKARDNIADWLDTLPENRSQIWVRVNAGDRRDEDIRAVAGHPRLTGIVLPKVDHPNQIIESAAAAPVGDLVGWAPMIESALGLVNIGEIAAADNVHQLRLGEIDLTADLGITPGSDEHELLYARSVVVITSRAAGLLAPAGPVSTEIDDVDTYRTTTRRLQALGFVGRDCIHPAQVEVANKVFSTSAEDVAWATEVLRTADVGAFRDRNGDMVDEAVLRRARRILATATDAPDPATTRLPEPPGSK